MGPAKCHANLRTTPRTTDAHGAMYTSQDKSRGGRCGAVQEPQGGTKEPAPLFLFCQCRQCLLHIPEVWAEEGGGQRGKAKASLEPFVHILLARPDL